METLAGRDPPAFVGADPAPANNASTRRDAVLAVIEKRHGRQAVNATTATAASAVASAAAKHGRVAPWPNGTNRDKWRPAPPTCRHRGKREAAVSSGFVRLRGKDSNLDYLIQSQASYH